MSDSRDQRELEFSDALLTELSQGIDRSGGTDPLAGMLLELRNDVERPMPAPPQLQAQVVELRDRRRVRPLFAGLVGAAAATLVIAGSGAVLFNAGPDSPLYGLSTKIFPRPDSAPDVVELASTLEEMNSLAERGDMDGVRLLIEQARLMAKDMEAASRAAANGAAGERPPSSGTAARGGNEATVTVTTTVPGAPAPAAGQEGRPAPNPMTPNPQVPVPSERSAPEPQPTVTETHTVTVTATVTAVPEQGTAGTGEAGIGYADPTVPAGSPAQELPTLAGTVQEGTPLPEEQAGQ